MSLENHPTPTLQVYDPPMCCSTGACGPSLDPALIRFAADLEWLGQQGVTVERFNLAQQPGAFANNTLVKHTLEHEGNACLPLILFEDSIVSCGRYPTREELAAHAGLAASEPVSVYTPAVAELVAIGAAIAANCEPCFKYHTAQAKIHGVSPRDMARAVAMAQAVKEAPARSILGLAERTLGCSVLPQDAGAPGAGTCCTPVNIGGSSKCR
jgi:AhpD family alkylhydroperoxidase